ncbi:enoyl-CoA hydratase/isomerase family protein [Microbacterium sp. BWT-B31]|uniref:enoyl-CoA hydratase/isomerase family protein n=1 Tax=Microbacterium sp. BWT-B31 TaxID=3232072 RepID=UPI003527D382
MTVPDGEITLSISGDGEVATILVDRSQKLNALTLPMLDQLSAVCDDIDRSKARVVVVRTAGERAFCVGADITNFEKLDSVEMWSTWITTGHRAFDRLANLRQPTVAIIDGVAVGGGLELALACDLRVVSSKARLGLPEAGLGTAPGWGGTIRLPELIGRARALDLMLTRRQLTAAEAIEWGLASRIADPHYLESTVESLVGDLLASAPLASQFIKQIVVAGGTGGPSSRVLEAFAGALAAPTYDLREGIAAFHEKRAPKFTGA